MIIIGDGLVNGFWPDCSGVLDHCLFGLRFFFVIVFIFDGLLGLEIFVFDGISESVDEIGQGGHDAVPSRDSGQVGRVFAEMLAGGGKAAGIVERKGLRQLTDSGEIEAVVDSVLAGEAENVALYKGGKTALFGHFVGAVMRESRGRANPKLVQQLLRDRLS